MTCVWLARKGRDEVPGIFSSLEKARQACQDIADEYFGPENTPALKWLGEDSYCAASYHHPSAGMVVFTVDRYVLDEVSRP